VWSIATNKITECRRAKCKQEFPGGRGAGGAGRWALHAAVSLTGALSPTDLSIMRAPHPRISSWLLGLAPQGTSSDDGHQDVPVYMSAGVWDEVFGQCIDSSRIRAPERPTDSPGHRHGS
jgi:hypothetical protein